ncbi:MAG: sulfotransferase family 2 domain-containing protein [Bacteroidia bacterium]|nr:sulfotransferase family 2 domain-containing protein [Bacteroidia bacterium]
MKAAPHQKIQVFSHLPKTGGSTVKGVLNTKYKLGSNFFHFAINGVKLMSRLYTVTPYEAFENKETFEGDTLLIFGHKVNEGMFVNLPIDKVELSTILRHPYRRLISQFFMRMGRNALQDKSSLQKYLRAKKDNTSCFYISRFPSLIDSPFDTLCNQAKSVLSYFDQIELLEDAPNSLDRILNRFGLEYQSEFDININAKKGYHKDITTDFIDKNIFNYLRQDLQLFNSFFNTKHVKKRSLPSTFLRPNFWIHFMIRVALKEKEKVFDAISNRILLKLLKPQLTFESPNYNILLESLTEINEFENLSFDMQVNLFDVLASSLYYCDHLPDDSIDKSQNIFSKTLQYLKEIKSKNLLDIHAPFVLEFPDGHLMTLLCKAKFLLNSERLNEAYTYFDLTIRTYPIEPLGFYEMMKFAKKTNDAVLEKKCFYKLVELDSKMVKEIIHSSPNYI